MTDLNSVANAGFQGTKVTDAGKSLKQKAFINTQDAKDSFMSSLKEKVKTNKKGLVAGTVAAFGIAGGIVYAVKTGKLQELIANIKGNKPAKEEPEEPVSVPPIDDELDSVPPKDYDDDDNDGYDDDLDGDLPNPDPPIDDYPDDEPVPPEEPVPELPEEPEPDPEEEFREYCIEYYNNHYDDDDFDPLFITPPPPFDDDDDYDDDLDDDPEPVPELPEEPEPPEEPVPLKDYDDDDNDGYDDDLPNPEPDFDPSYDK